MPRPYIKNWKIKNNLFNLKYSVRPIDTMIRFDDNMILINVRVKPINSKGGNIDKD